MVESDFTPSRASSEAHTEAATPRKPLPDGVAGDRVALECLLLRNYGRLHRHVARDLPQWLQGVVSVEDVLQETFAQAFRDFGRFEPRGEGSVESWLLAIADHRLHDLIRRHRRKKRGGSRRQARPADARRSSFMELAALLAAAADSPSDRVARDEAVQAVQVAVAALPDDQREAVRRRYLEREDLAAAAQAMGRTPEAVRSLVYRARQSLREFLGRSSRWFLRK